MKYIIVLIGLIFSSYAVSQDKNIDDVALIQPTSISIDVSSDSYKTKSYSIFADIAITQNNRLILGASKSITGDNLSTYKPGGATIGWSSDPLNDWVYGITLNTWGIPDEITANSISGSVKYASDNWDLQFIPKVRKINGFLTTGPKPEFTIMNTALSIYYNQYFKSNWQLTVGAESDSYDDRMQRLKNTIDQVSALAPNVSQMSQSFLKKLMLLEVAYHFKQWSPSLEIQSGETAISGTRFMTSIAKVFYKFNEKYSLDLAIGATKDLDLATSTNNFVSIGFIFSL